MPDVVGRFRAPRLSSPPASPTVGEMYYDTGTNRLYWWNGTVWFDATGGPPASGWVSVLSAQPVLEAGIYGQLRAGRSYGTYGDFAPMGLSWPAGLWQLATTGSEVSGNTPPRNLTIKGSMGWTQNMVGFGNSAALFSGATTQALYRADTGAGDPFRISAGSWGCWFRTAKRGVTDQLFVSKWRVSVPQRAWTLDVISTNVAVAIVSPDGTAQTYAYGVTDVADDRWHFVVATADGAALRLYVDGVLEATAPAGPIFASSAPVNMGGFDADASTSTGAPWFGAISDVFVTADVLSADQIRYLYCVQIPHSLGQVPRAVSLEVRRRRKGAALATADFPTQPLRLHNFTAGSLADLGSNATPLHSIVRLGTNATGFATTGVAAAAASISLAISPAIPVGATIILIGYLVSGATPTVSDSKGNTWTPRAVTSPGIFVADCQVTTALTTSDTVTVSMGATGRQWGWTVCWYSRCAFDKISTTVYPTVGDGGPITTDPSGGPVLGVFARWGAGTTPFSITTPGAGYTNETGYNGIDPPDNGQQGFDWESKFGAGGVVEDATATANISNSTAQYAATVGYKEAPLPTVAGADGAQGGGVQFPTVTGVTSLYATDAGLPSGLATRSYGCWIKTTATGSYGVMGWGTLGSGDARLIVNTGGILYSASSGDNTSGPFVADGQWHFVVTVEDNAAVDGVKRKIYLDGKLVLVSVTLNPITLAGGFRLGSNPDGTAPFPGQIDGAFVCGYALTGPQIAALYAKGSQPLGTSSKDVGAHIEAMDANYLWATFDGLESQHQIDLTVSA